MEFLSHLWLSQLESKSISDWCIFCLEPLLDYGKYLSRLFEKCFRWQRLEVNIFVIFLDLDLLTLNYIITLRVDFYLQGSYRRDILHCDFWIRFLFLLFIYLEFLNFGESHEFFPKT